MAPRRGRQREGDRGHLLLHRPRRRARRARHSGLERNRTKVFDARAASQASQISGARGVRQQSNVSFKLKLTFLENQNF